MKYMPTLFAIVFLLVLGSCTVEGYSGTVTRIRAYTCAQKQLPGVADNLFQSRIASFYQDTDLDISDINVVNKNDLWAVGHKRRPNGPTTESLILRSSNGGRSWEKQVSDPEHYFFDVYFVNTLVGWICGGDGLILKSTDGGRSWARQYAPTESDITRIQFIDPDWGWIIGQDGEVLRTTDGGLHWSSHRIEVDGWVYFLNFSDRLRGWIVGEKGQAYQSTDGGVSWKSRGTELVSLLDERQIHEGEFRAVKFINSKVGFIAAVIKPKRENEEDSNAFRKGVVFKTVDGGNSWRVFFEKNLLEVISAEFIDQNEAWIVHTHDSELLHTIDGGKNRISESNRQIRGVVRVHFADSRNGWAITGWGFLAHHLFYTSDGGKTWTESPLLVSRRIRKDKLQARQK